MNELHYLIFSLNNTPNLFQYQNFYGGDLQTIVEMGFGQNSQQDSTFQVSSFPSE